MPEPKSHISKRTCKDCGGVMPRAVSRHYCPAKHLCKRCHGPIPKATRSFYCSATCYRPINLKTCEQCKAEFHSKPHENARFCNRSCYELFRLAAIEHTCEHCGNTFTRPNCIGRKYRFCSRKCTTATQCKSITTACGFCKAPITRQPSFAKTKAIYCNRECFRQAQLDRVIIICKQCNAEISLTPYFAFVRKKQFCSRKCKVRFHGETGIERAVRLALDALHLTYLQEEPFPRHRKLGRPYHADFLLPSLAIDLEVDGTHWHGGKHQEDARRDAFVTALGYRVIRITDKEIQTTRSLIDTLRLKITTRRL